MATAQPSDIDFAPLDNLLAEQIFNALPVKVRDVLVLMVKRGATPQQIGDRVLTLLPTWQGTSQQWSVVCGWLKRTAQ